MVLLGMFTAVYVFCALSLAVFSAGQLATLLMYFRYRKQTPPILSYEDDTLPEVVVQLPIYNERYVIGRLIEAAALLDYPREKLSVQILDDSTDDTSTLVADYVARLQREGLNIEQVRRADRSGHKAGALAYGLTLTDAPYVALFDADFVPAPDFLRRTLPHFASDVRLAVVQTRWGHLNPSMNWLTRSQTINIDAHFVIEQTARSRAGWLLTFNGSGGVWRRAAIEDAGGWSARTLTEDLELSYRAQLRGWRFLMLPEIVVPGELPPQMAAFKRQQARWAQGSTQTFFCLAPALWHPHTRLRISQRMMGTLHLAQYIPNIFMLVLLLLTPPLLLTGILLKLPLAPLGLAGVIPPLTHAIAQMTLYPDWRRRLLVLPAQLAIGTGITINNSRAVLLAMFKVQSEFLRTPKFGAGRADSWLNRRYTLKSDGVLWAELGMAVYALGAALLAWHVSPAFVPYLGLYGAAFLLMAALGLRDLLLLRRARSSKRRALQATKLTR